MKEMIQCGPLEIPKARGGGELAYVVIRGCAIILGTFLGVAPGFLGIMFW